MRTTIVALLCSVLALSAHPSEVRFSQDATVKSYYAYLLEAGGLGLAHWEAAGFLLLPPDNRYRCIAWPFSNGRHQQKYRGRVPDFTVAIVHTHPLNNPMPSRGDQATARRLGMPVIVLTSRSIQIATPDERIVEVENDSSWLETVRGAAMRCEPRAERSVQARGR